MIGLTARQSQCLAHLQNHVARMGYPPTLRELGKAMKISSTNGVNDHLAALERKGFITRADKKSRAIILTDKNVAQRHEDGAWQKPNEWLWDPTPGLFVQRKRCIQCEAVTFGGKCGQCRSQILEVFP